MRAVKVATVNDLAGDPGFFDRRHIIYIVAGILTADGYRVLAIAYREFDRTKQTFSVADESQLTLLGYIAFFDPAKDTSAKAIAALVGQGQPATGSSVSWNCETCIVASSGDLGVSIGYIRSNADPKAPPSPFFTIWRKVAGGWKYVAE